MNIYQRIGMGTGLAAAGAIGLFADGLTPHQRTAAAMMALMAVWWMTEAIPIHWTSMIPLIVIPLFHVEAGGIAANIRPAILPYVEETIFLFLGGMIISAAMQEHGLHKRIALTVMHLIGAGPNRLLLGFIAATAFISLWISNTATAVMMVPIGLAVIAQLEAREGRKLFFAGQAIMLAIAYAANVGGIGTKIGTAPNAQFAGFVEKRFDISMGFVDYLVIGLPFVLIFLPVVWFVLARMMRKDRLAATGTAAAVRAELANLGPMRREELLTLGYFLLACYLWIAGKPTAGQYLGIDKGFDSIVAMTVALAMFLTPINNGRFLIDAAALRRIPWDTLLLLGGSFALAGAVEASKLSDWFGQQLGAVVHLDPLLLMVVICLITVFASAFTSNTATCAVLLVVTADALRGSGTTPLPYLAAVTIASSCDFMLPCGTPPNAIVFGTRYVRMSDMVKTGVILDLLAALVAALWAWFGVRMLIA